MSRGDSTREEPVYSLHSNSSVVPFNYPPSRMLSLETWECFERNLKIGHALNCYGIVLRPVGKYYKVEFHRRSELVRFLTLLAFLGNLSAIPVELCFAFTCNQDIRATMLFLSTILAQVLVLGFQFWQWTLHEEIKAITSSFVEFQRHLCKIN